MFLKISAGVLVVLLAIHWRQTVAEEDQEEVPLSRQKRQCEIFLRQLFSRCQKVDLRYNSIIQVSPT